MATGQKLRGLVGQGMSGTRRPFFGHVYQYAVGSYTLTIPVTGRWTVVQWGAGGNSQTGVGGGGGGGALCISERYLRRGQTVSIVIGTHCVVTLPDGSVITAGDGAMDAAGGVGGTASGGDINVNGSDGTASDGGAAGSYGELRGGAGGATNAGGKSPGGGSGSFTGLGGQTMAASGQVIIYLDRQSL